EDLDAMTESSGRVEGALRLRFERPPGESRTVLASAEQRAPLAVVRAFALDGGGALVHLHNLSGGVLGGDRLRLELEGGPGAWAAVWRCAPAGGSPQWSARVCSRGSARSTRPRALGRTGTSRPSAPAGAG